MGVTDQPRAGKVSDPKNPSKWVPYARDLGGMALEPEPATAVLYLPTGDALPLDKQAAQSLVDDLAEALSYSKTGRTAKYQTERHAMPYDPAGTYDHVEWTQRRGVEVHYTTPEGAPGPTYSSPLTDDDAEAARKHLLETILAETPGAPNQDTVIMQHANKSEYTLDKDSARMLAAGLRDALAHVKKNPSQNFKTPTRPWRDIGPGEFVDVTYKPYGGIVAHYGNRETGGIINQASDLFTELDVEDTREYLFSTILAGENDDLPEPDEGNEGEYVEEACADCGGKLTNYDSLSEICIYCEDRILGRNV